MNWRMKIWRILSTICQMSVEESTIIDRMMNFSLRQVYFLDYYVPDKVNCTITPEGDNPKHGVLTRALIGPHPKYIKYSTNESMAY